MRVQELTEEDALKQAYEAIDPELCPALCRFIDANTDLHAENKFHWIIDFTKCEKP